MGPSRLLREFTEIHGGLGGGETRDSFFSSPFVWVLVSEPGPRFPGYPVPRLRTWNENVWLADPEFRTWISRSRLEYSTWNSDRPVRLVQPVRLAGPPVRLWSGAAGRPVWSGRSGRPHRGLISSVRGISPVCDFPRLRGVSWGYFPRFTG